jgi:two-component system response regulator PilR (NtrC family)
MLENASVLVADDEEMLREVLDKLLTREGYRVSLAASGEEALQLAKSSSFDIAIVDVMMPGIDGIQTLEELKRLDDQMPVIICTAYGSKEILIRAINSGAKYFIEKPFKNNVILQRLQEALLPRQLIAENEILRENLKAQNHGFNEIVGNSPSMRQVFSLISQVAPSRSTILVEGESGTGKELVARAIHSNSPRNDRPFVTVNSGSLPPDLLESNLFGHVKGAFTGAIGPKKGLFEVAHKGTIFFDEIGSVPLDTQAKLLRVIQEREFMRLGGVETIKVDVRIVAATNVDLGQMVEQGKFREDLYYRLHVITLPLPPLRSRREDIPLLAQHFLELYGRENEKTDLKLMPATVRLLEESHWPGNVRELENVIERAVVLAADNKIGPELVPDSIHKTHTFRLPNLDLPPQGIQLRKVIDEIESLLIVRALEVSGGVQKKAAELLHVKPTTLNEMIKRYGLAQRRNRE